MTRAKLYILWNTYLVLAFTLICRNIIIYFGYPIVVSVSGNKGSCSGVNAFSGVFSFYILVTSTRS